MEPRYRIVGGLGAREKVLLTGLTREEAVAKVAELKRERMHPKMWFTAEEEKVGAHYDAAVAQMAPLHGW